MRRSRRSQNLMAEINITPFTDVILVLLIIFMVAAPLISQNNINVQLPDAASKETIDNPKLAYITITSEGVIYLENKVLTTKELKNRISLLLKDDNNMKVVVAADQACRFQEVVKVIDVLKETGVKALNIATEAK